MKGMSKKTMGGSYCVKEKKACVGWVEKYFKDCLCNLKDELSFGFGLISLVCWGVAEIPQIITNFQTKSGHGISLLFLLTWVAGDVFNLVGCLLEPATLPTQFYTALLYTASTVVLVLQCVYYDHFCRLWKRRGQHNHFDDVDGEQREPLKPESNDSSIPIPRRAPHQPSLRGDFYYMSARSLAGSNGTPSSGSYLRTARSGPSALGFERDSSSDDEATPASSDRTDQRFSQPRPIPLPRSAGYGYGAFLATSVNLPQQGKALMDAYAGIRGRRLLHEHEVERNVYGQWLGWLMAAIYMGGRIPQICLNIKRGSVEGLNPLMFIFALIANVTYVGSILVRTMEWEMIKANMPWLLDAIVCVALDLFIILQYIYYKSIQKRIIARPIYHDDYVEANKVVGS
ncbi:probable vacuolar amino acid transporter YPQ1 [Malania oleifera]|uniref:probable vacuolar amino acid transporter YPQ1 n=1 Tax=Malania oleifera TaxID=397392 RepID=UPI0025AE4D66|nr:probable vacuolar amino acid transporter YPQ1 [Malania oleifera]